MEKLYGNLVKIVEIWKELWKNLVNEVGNIGGGGVVGGF